MQSRLHSGSYGFPIMSFLVPKGPATTRILAIPELVDLVIYEALADWLAHRAKPLEHADAWSFKAERADARIKGWIEFQKELARVAAATSWVGLSDLSDFFETIQHRPLGERVSAEFNHISDSLTKLCRVREALEYLLGRWMPAERGIPQGPQASFFFADLFLLDVDRQLREASIQQRRWVDDRYFFSKTYQEAQRACRLSERVYRAKALTRSSQKSRVTSSDEFIREWKIDQLFFDAYWQQVRFKGKSELLDYVIGKLEEAIEYSSRHVVHFLLGRTADLLSQAVPKDSQVRALENLFRGSAVTRPQYLKRWWDPIYRLAVRVEVQELCADLIISQRLVDDTSIAWIYEAFLHAETDQGLLRDLYTSVSRDAALPEACASRRGKALVVASRYRFPGWEDMVPVDRAEFPELRRYQAVASQAIPQKSRSRWVGRLVKHCGSATESAFVEHFQYRQDPLWVTPLKERRAPTGYA